MPLLKVQAEEWAKATLPDLWKEVETMEYTEDPEGMRSYKIDRTINV